MFFAEMNSRTAWSSSPSNRESWNQSDENVIQVKEPTPDIA